MEPKKGVTAPQKYVAKMLLSPFTKRKAKTERGDLNNLAMPRRWENPPWQPKDQKPRMLGRPRMWMDQWLVYGSYFTYL